MQSFWSHLLERCHFQPIVRRCTCSVIKLITQTQELRSKNLSTIVFDFVNSLIEYHINNIVGPFAPQHHGIIAPCKSRKFYDRATIALDFSIRSVLLVYIEHIAIQSVSKKSFVKHWIYSSINAPSRLCAGCMDKRPYFRLKYILKQKV